MQKQLLRLAAIGVVLGIGLALVVHNAGRPANRTPTCSEGTLGFKTTFALTRDASGAVIGYIALGSEGHPVVRCRLGRNARLGSSVRVTSADGTVLFSTVHLHEAPPGTIVTQPSEWSVQTPAPPLCHARQPLTVVARGLGVEVSGRVRLGSVGGVCSLKS